MKQFLIEIFILTLTIIFFTWLLLTGIDKELEARDVKYANYCDQGYVGFCEE